MPVTYYEHGQWWQPVAVAPFRTDGQNCYEMHQDYHPDQPRRAWETLSKEEQSAWEQTAREVEEIVNN